MSSTLSRVDAASVPGMKAGWRGRLDDYVELTKPRIIALLLITTLAAMIMAARGVPNLLLVLWTLLGGALSAASAGAINCVWDRDIDRLMTRTMLRPVARGALSARDALIFAALAQSAGFTLLFFFVNPLAAWLSLGGNAYYVFVYTMWLKRITPLNIVVGGAAGAIPPLVGWAAVTGSVSGTAVLLFFIVFFWTPPHFWALSLLMKGEYEKVGVPMLPVVRGEAETRRQILLYSILLYAVTQLPFCAGGFGLIYLAASLVLGLGFIAGAVRLYRRADRQSALRLYLYSLAYLALLFCAMVADRHL